MLVPLARSPNGDRVVCARCGMQIRDGRQDDNEERTEEQVRLEDEEIQGEDRAGDASEDRKMEEGRRGRGARSGAEGPLGERLLSGWTMLAEACGVCGAPLMGQGDVVECVVCGTGGRKEEEKDAAMDIDVGSRKEEKERDEMTTGHPAHARAIPEESGVLESARRRLMKCMHVLTERLDKTTTTSALDTICVSIGHCAHALESVQRLMDTYSRLHERSRGS